MAKLKPVVESLVIEHRPHHPHQGWRHPIISGRRAGGPCESFPTSPEVDILRLGQLCEAEGKEA